MLKFKPILDRESFLVHDGVRNHGFLICVIDSKGVLFSLFRDSHFGRHFTYLFRAIRPIYVLNLTFSILSGGFRNHSAASIVIDMKNSVVLLSPLWFEVALLS